MGPLAPQHVDVRNRRCAMKPRDAQNLVCDAVGTMISDAAEEVIRRRIDAEIRAQEVAGLLGEVDELVAAGRLARGVRHAEIGGAEADPAAILAHAAPAAFAAFIRQYRPLPGRAPR